MKIRIVSYTLLIIALVFIVTGILQGDYMDAFNKAALICLECIGIG